MGIMRIMGIIADLRPRREDENDGNNSGHGGAIKRNRHLGAGASQTGVALVTIGLIEVLLKRKWQTTKQSVRPASLRKQGPALCVRSRARSKSQPVIGSD